MVPKMAYNQSIGISFRFSKAIFYLAALFHHALLDHIISYIVSFKYANKN